MPIDFPNNPTTGLTYSYGGQLWEYNGVGWDKVIIADLAYDSDALYGISGYIYASSLATGLLYGGIISINSGNSAAFDITAGKGQIHTSGSTFTAVPNPTLQFVTWPAQTGITLQYLATNDTTWIYIDGTGTVQQRTEYYTDTQLEETIIIGQLIHPSRTFINLARTNPNVAYATDKQYEQFIRSFGPIKISGHTIQPNGANLKLNRTSGSAFSLGRNWINDTDNPSVVTDAAQTDCIFYRYYRGATAGTFITVPNQTVIDPTKYDDGTGTLATVPGGKYTIQRLFYYPNTPTLLGVYYGRAEYTSLADAAANINFENFTEIENTRTNAIFVGYLLIKSGCTDITNTSDALILQAGNFRSTTSGGGSVSLTLDDLTDVIITSPQNHQVLTYVDGVTGWENHSVSSLPLVSSFNGLTGAVTGVGSIRGLTGAVGITNGSGIGLSVSGNTLTFSNTGVLSFNGLTGAVTGVTTGTANIFGPLQSFNSGVSAAFIRTPSIQGSGGGDVIFDSGAIKLLQLGFPSNNTTRLTASSTVDQTITLPDDTGTVALTKNVVSSFNGLTGSITGVSSVRGLTGAVGITNGSGIGLSVSGQTMTFSNTGVLSVNGSTGSVITYAGTTGNIQFRYNNGVTANNYFTLESANLGEITEVFTLSGATNSNWYLGNQEAIGLQIRRAYNGLGLDESGGVQIKVLGIGNDTGDIYASNLRITTPPNTSAGSSIILDAGGNEGFEVAQNFVASNAIHEFGSGINSYNLASTNTFAGPINAAGATFSSLVRFNAGISAAGGTFSGLARFNAGISAAGATLSSNITIPSGSTLTVSGNFVANGNVNLGDATTDSITVAGLLAANAGISSAGGTFSSQTRFLTGITVDGGATFATDISVFGIRVGRGNRGACAGGDTNLAVGANALNSVVPNPGAFSGIQNLAFGTSALQNTTSGGYNSAFGTEALLSNTIGVGNIAFGVHALRQNQSGNENCAFGGGPLYQQISGNNNVAIGSLAMYYKSTGSNNVAIGFRAGRNFGTPAGSNYVTSANNSIYIGQDSTALANAPSNEIVIGYNTVGFGNNTTTIGNTAATATHIRGLLNVASGISASGATFSGLVRFNAGISAAGGTFSGLAIFNAGISAAGGTFSGTQTFVNGATFSSGINITGNVTASGALIGYQQINAQTGTTYTAVLSDVSKLITLNNASGITMTIPLNSSVAFPTGTVLYFVQLGAGQVGFTGASGVTLNFTPGRFLRTQYSTASAIQLSTNIWLLSGDLTA